MKLLIADKLSPRTIEVFDQNAWSYHSDSSLKDDTLLAQLREQAPNVLIVRSTKVSAEMLQASPSLELIIRAGAGVNSIDCQTAAQLGIYVANCPGKNAVAVAELCMGLVLALDRHIPDNVIALREKSWNKKRFGAARGLKGRTLGVIGFGAIAQEVITRAKGFDLDVIAWSRSLNEETAQLHGVAYAATPHQLAANSDIVSVHLALNEETRGFCSNDFFDAMKTESYFINTSRGEIVDENALLQAIEEKGIRAGLDVFQNEPSSSTAVWESKTAMHPQVYGTHHIGASSAQAEDAIGEEVIEILSKYSQSGFVRNCVNQDSSPATACVLHVRHLNKVGVLANVLEDLQKADINVLEMKNLIFEGHTAAVASIQLSSKPKDECVNQLASREHILSVSLR